MSSLTVSRRWEQRQHLSHGAKCIRPSQTNVVEGLEAAPTSLYTSKFYEVADKLIMTDHINLGVTLLMNEQFFQSMPEEYQQVILDVMREIADEQQQNTVSQQEGAVEQLKAEGVTGYRNR